MILHKDHVETMGNLTIKKEISFSIAPTAMKHVMHMLSNMYSDPYRAIAREYIANAVDAHRVARMRDPGARLPPISVHIPSHFDSTFRVRDFGPGMTIEETSELLSNFGASGAEKRTTDALIGGWGLGSKSGFAVSDTFSFTVFQGGRKRVWVCTTRDDAARALQMVSDLPTEEPSGVEVSVPIKAGNEHRVHNGVRYVLSCLNEQLDIGGGPQKREWTDHQVDGATLSVPDTELEDASVNGLTSHFICGDFLYPIDPQASGLDKMAEWETFDKISGLDEGVARWGTLGTPEVATKRFCQLKFPAGTFKLSPSRESIIWDEAAKDCLQSAVRAVVNKIRTEATKIESEATTPLEFLRLRNMHVQIGIYGPFNRYNRHTTKLPPSVYNGVTYTSENAPGISWGGPGLESDQPVVRFVKWGMVGRRYHRKAVLLLSTDHRYDHMEELDDDLRNLLSDVETRTYRADHARYATLKRFKWVQTEAMGNVKLTEQIATVFPMANDKELLVIVGGNETTRKDKIKELEGWLADPICDHVLKAPVQPARATGGRRCVTGGGDGGGTVKSVRQTWMQINERGACCPHVADPEDVVVNLGGVFSQDNAVLAYRFIAMASPFVPELEGAKLYSLTADQLKKHNKEPQCKTVYDWHKKFFEWVNAWAQADGKQNGLGFEVLALSNPHGRDWMTPEEEDPSVRCYKSVFQCPDFTLNANGMLRMYDGCVSAGVLQDISKIEPDNSPIERFLYYLFRRRASDRNIRCVYGDGSVIGFLKDWMHDGKHNPYGKGNILSDKSRAAVKRNAEGLLRMMEDVVYNNVCGATVIDRMTSSYRHDRGLDKETTTLFFEQMKKQKFPPKNRPAVKQD